MRRFWRAVGLCAALAAAPALRAQDDVPFVVTPDHVTLAMLELAQVGPQDFVLDLGSGDSDPTDQSLETFNPMFPKGAYFNEAGLTSWGNLTALRASLGVAPARTVALEASYAIHRCRTGADAIYLQPLTPLVARCGGPSKDLGGATQLDGTWQVNRNFKLQGQLVRQTAGEALRVRGGKAVTFATLVTQFRF